MAILNESNAKMGLAIVGAWMAKVWRYLAPEPTSPLGHRLVINQEDARNFNAACNARLDSSWMPLDVKRALATIHARWATTSWGGGESESEGSIPF